jgi:hypothetical protein
MQDKQIKLLRALGKRLLKEKRSPEQSLLSLQEAKILDKQGNFTRPYRNLAKLITPNT